MNLYERFTLLGVFHYVLAGFSALFGFVPLIHVTLGVMMLAGRLTGPNPPPRELGYFFVAFGVAASLFMWGMAVAKAACGYYLRVQRHHTFCLVVGAIECLNMPLGTILGVFTIVTLADPQAEAMFDRPPLGLPASDTPSAEPMP